MSRISCSLYNLSSKLTDYSHAWQYQKALVEYANSIRKTTGTSINAMLVVQHPSIYTLGRGATVNNLKFDVADKTHSVVRVERGGEVTWHGPGQIVAYPIFDLNSHKKDLHWFANRLEQTVIDTLKHYDVVGERSDVNTGVWVGKNKISALGVTASRWITMHGIAFNVGCDLNNYSRIIPCGIALPDRGVISLEKLTGVTIDQQLLVSRWLDSFSNVFNLDIVNVSDGENALMEVVDKFPAIKSAKPDLLI